MSKKVIHMQIPTNENGIMFDLQTVKVFLEKLQKALPSDYEVVATPFELVNVTDINDNTIENISMNELIEETTTSTVKDLIAKDKWENELCKIRFRVMRTLEKRLDEMNKIFTMVTKEEDLQMYNEYAKLLIEIKKATGEEFGELDLGGRKDSLKVFIIEAIQNI